MCVNNLSKVALDSAAAGIEPAISSRKSNALTTTPPSHTSALGLVVSLKWQICKNMQVVYICNFVSGIDRQIRFTVWCFILTASH